MNLEDLNKLARDPSDDPEEDCCKIQTKDGEVFDPDEPQSVEEDLTDALDYCEQMLLMMEQVHIRGGKVTRIPKGFLDLMEEVGEFLEQWEIGNEK